LGQVRVERDGWPLALSLPPNAWLLWAYLLLHANGPLLRQQVAFTLWPDVPEADALARLRRQLYVLQRGLPPSPAGRSWFLARRTTIQWNPAAEYWLDVQELRERCAEEEAASVWTDDERIAHLAGAVALYRGDFLADSYDDWVLAERERLSLAYLAALERLCALYMTVGDVASALAAAQRLVALEELNEAAHRRVIGLTYLAGDRAAALQAFEACRQQIGQALAVAPMAETLALVAAIREARPAEEIARLLQLDRPPPPYRPALAGRPPAHPLPTPPTSFIGRVGELEEVTRLLATTRLLTLTGPGGCGKTRLALQVAATLVGGRPETARRPVGSGEAPGDRVADASREQFREQRPEFPDGVAWVELATLAEPMLVPQAVATALGVREERGGTPAEALERLLRAKALLLVLDNCEHLVEACALLVEGLLRSCPGVRVLATSRELLGIPGELACPVPGLSVPAGVDVPTTEELWQSEAARLFVERARFRQPSLALAEHDGTAVAAICRRLDGNPLAIELAAAKVGVLPVSEIAARLGNALGLLTSRQRTGWAHHQTLRTALEWSYDLLTAPERAVFERLSVFAGGFALETAEAICGGGVVPDALVLDLLSRLVDKSLLQTGPAGGGTMRYRLLEILRQFGSERLAAGGEADELRDRHARHFRALAEQSEPQLSGPRQALWLDRLSLEHDNLRAALRWSVERPLADVGLRLAAALWPFWAVRGHYREGRDWLAQLLALPGAAARGEARAKALVAAGALANYQGDHDAARAYDREALAIWRELGDEHGLAVAQNVLGLALYDQGDYAGAHALFEESLTLRRALGDRHGVAYALGNLGLVAHVQGDLPVARALYEECLAILRELGDRGHVATALSNLASVAYDQGDYVAARRLYADGLTIWWELDARQGVAYALEGFAGVAVAEGQLERAVRLAGAAAALRQALGSPLAPADRDRLQDQLEHARRALDETAYDTAWSAGHHMALEDAVHQALHEAAG
jgi:predicted ATPase/DNA-binding SARP family transcriptional activator